MKKGLPFVTGTVFRNVLRENNSPVIAGLSRDGKLPLLASLIPTRAAEQQAEPLHLWQAESHPYRELQ